MTNSYDDSIRRVVFTLFGLTAVTSVIYPFVWLQLFSRLFGSSIDSNFIIVGAFITGVGVGAYLGGIFVDFRRNEFKTFMYLEIATAIFAVLLLIIYQVAAMLYRPIFQNLYTYTSFLKVVNFVVAFFFFLPLTGIIGAKFSVLGRYLIRSENVIAQEMGSMFNNFIIGLVAGAVLLFPLRFLLGLHLMILFNIIINLIIAGVIKFLSHKISQPGNVVAEFYDQNLKYFSESGKYLSRSLIDFIIIGNGISALVVISFILTLFLTIFRIHHASLFNQSAVIAGVFLSIGIGSYISIHYVREDRNLLFKFIFFQVIIGFILLAAVFYLPKIIAFNYFIHFPQNFDKGLMYFLDILIIMVSPIILFGIMLPIMSKIYLTRFKQIGKRIGAFYASLFLGIVIGYSFTIILFVPFLGLTRTLIALACITFILATIILFKAQRYTPTYKVLLSAPLHVIIILFYIFFPDFDNFNNFDNAKIIEHVGSNSVYSVVQSGSMNSMNLKVNGREISGNNNSYKIAQRLLGNIPMLLCPSPGQIFVSGFGTGEVISSIKNYEIEHIDCAEPSDEVIHLSKYFSRIFYNVQSDEQVDIITNHSDTYLHLTNKQYDVIVINYLHPEKPGNDIYYTQEYFSDCSEHLNPDGIVALNISLKQIAFDKLQVLINTFYSVFPHTSLWFNNNDYSYNVILIGTKDDEYKIDYKLMYDRLQKSSVRENLAEIRLFDIYETLDCYICGPNSMSQLIQQQTTNRFYDPYYRLAKKTQEDRQTDITQHIALFKKLKEPVTYLLENMETPEEEDVVKLILNMYYKSSRYVFDGLIFELEQNIPLALQAFRLGYQVNKLDNGAKRFIDAYYNPKLIPYPQTPQELTENAKIYYQKMEHQKAIDVLNEAISLDKRYAPAYFGLGINYEILNDTNMAMRMYRATLRLKPQLKHARDRLNNLIMQRNEFEKQFKRGIFNKSN